MSLVNDYATEGFPHGENFYTTFFALALIKARGSMPDSLDRLPIWWKEQSEPDGNLGGLLKGTQFSVDVLQEFGGCGIPDLRLAGGNVLVLIETKKKGKLEPSQWEAIDWLEKRRENIKAYLLVAPGGYGEAGFHPGLLSKFYQKGRANIGVPKDGFRVGYSPLGMVVNWAADVLGVTKER
jgi:hypothetical protein